MLCKYDKYWYTDFFSDIPADIKVKMSEDANLFYSESYYNFYNKNTGSVFYFYSDKMILMAGIQKKLFFKWVNLPSEPYVFSETEDGDLTDFLNAFICVCKKMSVDWVAPTAATAFFKAAPSNAIEIPFGSHVIDLENDVDILWSNIHSKHRNVIRNAEKKGVKVVQGGIELLDDYIKIDNDTWERSGKKSVISDYCKKLLEDMPEFVKIYMAYYEGEPQSGAIYLQNKQMSYYMYGASKNNPLTGATNLLHWVAINDAKMAGIKKYSFVGCRINEDENSKYHGIQRFKARFGGELLVGKMFKVIINSTRYKLYKLLKKLRDKQEVKDVIDQEIHKWR